MSGISVTVNEPTELEAEVLAISERIHALVNSMETGAQAYSVLLLALSVTYAEKESTPAMVQELLEVAMRKVRASYAQRASSS